MGQGRTRMSSFHAGPRTQVRSSRSTALRWRAKRFRAGYTFGLTSFSVAHRPGRKRGAGKTCFTPCPTRQHGQRWTNKSRKRHAQLWQRTSASSARPRHSCSGTHILRAVAVPHRRDQSITTASFHRPKRPLARQSRRRAARLQPHHVQAPPFRAPTSRVPTLQASRTVHPRQRHRRRRLSPPRLQRCGLRPRAPGRFQQKL
mmetsp:Transcript_10833/g.33574  ORF Transcript_10833/g.33574 Transcript_10833/m.33574 type:complete len:202 (-) Transcript_10833:923-1528(-)